MCSPPFNAGANRNVRPIMRSHHAVQLVGHRISVGHCGHLDSASPSIHILHLAANLMCSVISPFPRGIAATPTSDALCRQASLCTYALYFESDDNLDNLLSYRQRTSDPVSGGYSASSPLKYEQHCLTFACTTHSRP